MNVTFCDFLSAQVWDTVSSRPLVDYVNIAVGYAIQPAELNVLLGDVVCFNSPLVTDHGKHYVCML